MAERLIDEALKYAMERKQFGQPIAEFQLIQAMLADSKTEAYAARCMVLDAARKRDAGHSVPLEAACCKYFASEMVGRVADRAVQIHGGHRHRVVSVKSVSVRVYLGCPRIIKNNIFYYTFF